MDCARSIYKPDLDSGPILAVWRGERGTAQLQPSHTREKEHGPALTQLWLGKEVWPGPKPHMGLGNLAAGEGSGINYQCFPTAKYPNPWGTSQARCHGSVSQICPKGQREPKVKHPWLIPQCLMSPCSRRLVHT